MKICSKCKKELELNMFYRDKNKKDGHRYPCKECDNKWRTENKDRIKKTTHIVSKEDTSRYNKNYYKNNVKNKAEYYHINKDTILERKKIYCEENKKVIAFKSKEYQSLNKETIEKYNGEYRETHKEVATEYAKIYQKNNKEKFNIINERRRSKAKQLISTLTNKEWENIKTIFNNKCAYCGKEKSLTQEHIIPVSKGGNYTKENIICACQSCNSSKGTKDFLTWYKKYKYYSSQREQLIISNYQTLNEHLNMKKHILIEEVISI